MLLPLAMTTITAVLLLYSLGVLLEVRHRCLTGCDLLYFCGGFLCDAVGTALMTWMGNHGSHVLAPSVRPFMAVTGTVALGLMLLRIIAATYCLKTSRFLTSFHRFSLVVWLFWLVSYAAGPIGIIAS